MAGSSAGGAIIPLILRTLFRDYGWTRSIRIIAFMALGCYSAGIFLVKGRLPASELSRATIDLRAFKAPRLCFLAVAVFAFEFIIFGCAALLPTYVRYTGLDLDIQFYSLTVLNGMSLMGRVLPGFAADQVGRFNILLSLALITLIVMASVWIPFGSHSDATLYAVVAIFGFGSGGWISLAPVCAGQLCRTEEYGRFYGTIYSIAAFGVLLTVPVGGELLQSTTPQALVGFYAAVLLIGLISVALSRWALLDWRWRWKVKV
jgi:MFS family permease